MNKYNYTRYGTYYSHQLDSLEDTHPGAKAESYEKGLSVCRNSFNVGQSIDGAGEETFMSSFKTTGKKSNFTSFVRRLFYNAKALKSEEDCFVFSHHCSCMKCYTCWSILTSF